MSTHNDLPKGYRWATAEETERILSNERIPHIVVILTTDSSGEPYTGEEADIAVPYSTKSHPNKNYILQLMRDDDIADDPWGTAMAWGFAAAECLTVLGSDVPMDYRPSPFVQVETPETYEPESYPDSFVWEFLDIHSEVWDADAADRISVVFEAAKILDRYLDWLRAAGKDY